MNKFTKFARFVVLFLLSSMLIIAFAFWGIGDMIRSGGRSAEVAHVGGYHLPIYGWVGGASVSSAEVREQYNRQLEAFERQYRRRPTTEEAMGMGLHVSALEDVIQRTVLDYAIREFGLTASEAQVAAAIARNPAFQGTGGSFDPRSVVVAGEADDAVLLSSGVGAGERVVSGATFLIDSESRLRAAVQSTPADPHAGHGR